MNEERFRLASGHSPEGSIPICIASDEVRDRAIEKFGETARNYAASVNPAGNETLVLPGPDGRIAGVVSPPPSPDNPFGNLHFGMLAKSLPTGTYHLAEAPGDEVLASLGWALGTYRFDEYRNKNRDGAILAVADAGVRDETARLARGVFLTRDLINTPANDMGPEDIESAARELAERHGAAFSSVVGDELLTAGFPIIHAVGRASSRAPRLIDLVWGNPDAPKVTLVGKGVAFDTGGLDIKPPSGMLLMKKDMGGAANVLGLASMLMESGVPIRLRVLIPAVENSISGDAFRPGDVLKSRKGMSIEIGNTDAEGRLILADAIALADEEAPDLLIDMATLTGAARVALGPDLPPFYSRDDELCTEIQAHGQLLSDPSWRMPLWQPYDAWLKGDTGEIDNAPGKPFAGSITAALFIARFVEHARAWVHFDVFGWAPESRAHGPKGGEAQCIRALDALIRARFSG